MPRRPDDDFEDPDRRSDEAGDGLGASGDGGTDPWTADDPVRLPLEDTIDLHSFLPHEVASVVEEYLREAHAAGITEVRIVHGRGIGVQREIVRAVLARTPFVLSFGDAPPEGGGWGATIARLTVEGDPR